MPEICSFSTILENYFLWAAAMSGATGWRLHWGPRTKLCFLCFLIAKYVLFVLLVFIKFFCFFCFFLFFVFFFIIIHYVFLCILFYYFYYFCSFYCFSMHNYSYLSRIHVNMNIIQVCFFYIHVVPTLR
jgi:hypothetical protein